MRVSEPTVGNHFRRTLRLVLLAFCFAGIFPLTGILVSPSHASVPNRVHRVDIRPKSGYTRISIGLEQTPEYRVESISGQRLRIVIRDTTAPLFKRHRRYSDTNIGGLLFSHRGSDTLITLRTASGTGWREPRIDGNRTITLDIGKRFTPPPPRPSASGREKIWSGIEKLVRDFDPPLKTDIPFQQTDRNILKNILNDADLQMFTAAESALYKGRLTEAEEAFYQFSTRQAPIRSLALYRLGETCYKLQKYPQALSAFREAEKLWPAYLNFNHSITFYYGDSIVRSGDLAAGRVLLAGLISRLADKKFAPTLLVRLGDILARQGHDQEALALYRTVADNFRDNKAHFMARLRLNDREFLHADRATYRPLSNSYLEIAGMIGDFDMREESHFKHVLLESLHNSTAPALQAVSVFQRKYPRGVYATVVRTMREVLAGLQYRETDWNKDPAGLIRFVEEQREYLSACMDSPGFLENVAAAYSEAGRPLELIRQFQFMSERPWAAAGLPFIYEEIATNAELLGDSVLAEKMLRAFLHRFPASPRSRLILERAGALAYADNRYKETKDSLLWLLNKGEKAHNPESYYFLGSSLLALKDFTSSSKAIDLYLAAAQSAGLRQQPDAFVVGAAARSSAGDRKGALRLLDAGLRLPGSPRNDEFLYKTAELYLLEGNHRQAHSYFTQVATKGKDPDWQRLAQQALDTLETKRSP